MKRFTALAFGPHGWGAYEVAFSSNGPEFSPCASAPAQVFAPGFVDVHIHGGFGYDVMSSGRDGIRNLCTKLREEGYEYWLPTTVTATIDQTRRAVDSLPDDPSILGFHLEGPFISPKYPGAQPPEHIADPSRPATGWNELLAHPLLRQVTLAPELDGSLEVIAGLSRRGVNVSVGHTEATYGQCLAGRDAGASQATHIFNAMRPFHHREPGAAGWALTSDDVYAELIYDRVHVVPDAAKLVFAAKPEDKVLAISDGTMAVGLAPGTELDMWGHACVVGDGDVRLRANGALAGSAITLRDAFRNLAQDFGPKQAVLSCCLNPRRRVAAEKPVRTWCLFGENYELDTILIA